MGRLTVGHQVSRYVINPLMFIVVYRHDNLIGIIIYVVIIPEAVSDRFLTSHDRLEEKEHHFHLPIYIERMLKINMEFSMIYSV